MTVGIDDGKFVLFDNWPGALCEMAIPADMTAVYATAHGTGATTDAPCPDGYKVAIYQATNHGFSTFIMLQYEKGTAVAVAVKGLCGLDTTEAAAAGAQYIVTNDGGEAFCACGLAAVALNTMADGEHAFFWCGGVCPVDTVAGLDGVHKSDGSLTAGNRMYMLDSASICKLALLAENVVAEGIGFAVAADTTS